MDSGGDSSGARLMFGLSAPVVHFETATVQLAAMSWSPHSGSAGQLNLQLDDTWRVLSLGDVVEDERVSRVVLHRAAAAGRWSLWGL